MFRLFKKPVWDIHDCSSKGKKEKYALNELCFLVIVSLCIIFLHTMNDKVITGHRVLLDATLSKAKTSQPKF